MAAIRRYKRCKLDRSSIKDCRVNLTDVMDDVTWTLTPTTAHGTYLDGERLVSVTTDSKRVLGKRVVSSRVNGLHLFWFVEDCLYPVYMKANGTLVVNTLSRFKTKEEALRTCLRSLVKINKIKTDIKCFLVLGKLIIRAYPTNVKGFVEKKKNVKVFKFFYRKEGLWEKINSLTIYVIR